MTNKGFPFSDDVVGLRIHNDFQTPIAVLRDSALSFNAAQMSRFCDDHNVLVAPHGKTSMSPELIERQLAAGAWGMTAATAWQARQMISFGAQNVILANECVDPVGLRWIAEHIRDRRDQEIYCFVDSESVVDHMTAILSSVHGAPPVPVVVELGVDGGRCGARSVDAAVRVGRYAAASPALTLVGVGGFEGVIGSVREPAVDAAVAAFLADIRMAAEVLMSRDAFDDRNVMLTAGGSMFFDEVAAAFAAHRDAYARPVDIVLRSGCYLTHDNGMYAASSPADFHPAIEVWARVISTPEPGLALLDAGRRDVSFDSGMPKVTKRLRHGEGATFDDAPVGLEIKKLNDQHAFVYGRGLEVGDLVALGISHPCTTFDKWRAMPIVDDDYRVLSVAHTAF